MLLDHESQGLYEALKPYDANIQQRDGGLAIAVSRRPGVVNEKPSSAARGPWTSIGNLMGCRDTAEEQVEECFQSLKGTYSFDSDLTNY